MQDSTESELIDNNSQRRFKTIPDYTADRFWAKTLANRLQKFYHDQGHLEIKVWLEPRELLNGRKQWDIRSNISFSCFRLLESLK